MSIDLCYSQLWETSFCPVQGLLRRLQIGLSTENKWLWVLSPLLWHQYHLLPPKIRGHGGRRDRKKRHKMEKRDLKWCLLYTTWLLNSWIQLRLPAEDLQNIMPVKTAAWMGEMFPRLILQLRSYWQLLAAWEGRTIFFFFLSIWPLVRRRWLIWPCLHLLCAYRQYQVDSVGN